MSNDYNREMMEATRELGVLTLKTLITLNGGAIVALLAFIGTASKTDYLHIGQSSLKTSMSLFVAGLVVATITILYTTWASHKARGLSEKTQSYEGWFYPTFMVLVCFCIGFFALGAISIVCGIQAPNL